MRIRLSIPDRVIGPETLEPVLEAVTRANEAMIRSGMSPTARDLLVRGVRWAPEAETGYEAFDMAETMLRRGTGDCDDWAPLQAGSDRATGRDPGSKVITRRTGPNRWHAIVQHSDGSIEDPSRTAGMGQRRNGAAAPITTPIGIGACLGIRQYGGRWQARADLPWGRSHASLSATASAAAPRDAIEQAARHACIVGYCSGTADQSDLLRIAAMGAASQQQPGMQLRAELERVGFEQVDAAIVDELEQDAMELFSSFERPSLCGGERGRVTLYPSDAGPCGILRW